MNNDWITDRPPTAEDADSYGDVWNCLGYMAPWETIQPGEPWMPTNHPKPYVVIVACPLVVVVCDL